MKQLLVLPAVFASLVLNAQAFVRPNEEVILSFQTTTGKQAYLVKEKSNGYIAYRFGTKSKIEMEFPAAKEGSWSRFTYSFYLRGGGKENEGMDLNYVYFTNNGYRYVIYQTYSAADGKREIGLKVTALKTSKTTDVKGATKTQKGTLIDLRDNDLIEKSDEIFD